MKFDFSKTEYDQFIEHCGFTDEELEIINLLRRGRTYGQITGELYMCEKTVYNKTKRIKYKIIKYINEVL